MAMDLITSPTTGAAIGTQPTTLNRTPDSDTETPPPPPHQTAKRVLQNHAHAPLLAAVVSYKECLKNHAASIGGHALDGCCEFMPGPSASPSDPTSLKCAACGCHRNFHRRDPDDPAPLHHHPPATARPPHSPPSASQLLLSLSGQSPSRPSDEINPTAVIFGYHHHHPPNNNNNNNNNGGQNGNSNSHGSSRKRFRTKFSQEQKEKMYEFSEKIGWKLRKGEEKLVEDFCKEVGVVRGVFKVWMHNNKHSSSSSSSLRREKEQPDLLHLHHHHQQLNNNNNNNNNNGSCGSVVDHQFYASNGAQQEAQ